LTWDYAVATGTIYPANGWRRDRDSLLPESARRLRLPLHVPIDTIPRRKSSFKWSGFDVDFGSTITGYMFKLTETEFVRTDSTVTSVAYGPGTENPAPLPIGSTSSAFARSTRRAARRSPTPCGACS
jgi:hypothetical protein